MPRRASASISPRHRPSSPTARSPRRGRSSPGFWILEVASREEAELWAKKCPLGPGVSLEVRRVQEFSDIDVDPDNEWLAKEQEWRASQA